MSNHVNIGVSVITDNEGKFFSQFPPQIKSEQSIEDNIKDAVFKSMNFSSKMINTCEFTGVIHKEGVYMFRLDGANYLNDHHCSGQIMYHEDNKKYIKEANIYFECYYNYIQKYSLTDLKLNFERSNGDISEGSVPIDSGILYIQSRDALGLYIDFIENNQKLYKWVTFIDTVSKSTGKLSKGLITLNPELQNHELIIYIKKHPEWLNEDRVKWLTFMDDQLKKTNLKYSLRYEE